MTARFNRRTFLLSSSLTLGLPGLMGLSATGLCSAPGRPHKIAAVFQEMSFVSQNFRSADEADGYSPPQRNHATVEYVSTLSDEMLLRRHWFA